MVKVFEIGNLVEIWPIEGHPFVSNVGEKTFYFLIEGMHEDWIYGSLVHYEAREYRKDTIERKCWLNTRNIQGTREIETSQEHIF